MFKREEVPVRDPFVMLDGDTYYMYGTRPETVWGHATGFDVYKSSDLENWEGPFEVFHKTNGFWADMQYWAPEVKKYRGKYYLIATFGSEAKKPVKGIQVLAADQPTGPFYPLTKKPITPDGWDCLDGTLYFEDDQVWMVCSHSVPQEPRGEMCLFELAPDLIKVVGHHQTLFFAEDVSWSQDLPFAKQEFGINHGYFSDGPYLFKQDGKLCMLWSTWYNNDYAMAVSYSASGKIQGPWKHPTKPIIEHGGHGMVFRDKNGVLNVTYHSPNDTPNERAVFIPINSINC